MNRFDQSGVKDEDVRTQHASIRSTPRAVHVATRTRQRPWSSSRVFPSRLRGPPMCHDIIIIRK
ncbi:hypothetical protein EYF80_045280 [Liparis tanakae]|uniref:Uncharacterized protein n=1 Tax=Liparis tanakae TaxID=230148 RepID=A0A4Z2FV04_9TELE|nr:hypothetical protein EYF80_045280 [Liparis tanakae]